MHDSSHHKTLGLFAPGDPMQMTGSATPPPAKTPTPVLNPAAVVGQVNSNQTVQIVNYDSANTYTITVTAGSYTLNTSTGVITWTLPSTANPSGITLSVVAEAPGQDPSNTANCPATVSAQPVTAAPVLGTPSTTGIILGASYTVPISNWNSYAAGRTVRTVPTSGVLLNATTGVLTVTPQAVGTSTLTVFVTETGKVESTGVSATSVSVATALTAIDPINDGTIIANSDLQQVYHMHRLISGYTGPTVRLRRNSDSVQADFGVDVTGRLDISTINAWRGSSAVTFIGHIDQMGSGRVLLSTTAGSHQFCDAAGLTVRHGFTHSTANDDTAGQLTLSNTEGCPGIQIGTGATLTLDNSGLTTAEGLEFYLSTSYTVRCAPSNSAQPTALGNDASTQRLVMSYGKMETNFNVIAPTPELRRWSDTATAGNAPLRYQGNSSVHGQNTLELLIGTTAKNPSFNFTSAQEALVRTATNTLYCGSGQGDVIGCKDSDVAIAPGTGPHMKAPATFKICSTSYQTATGGPLPPSTLLVSAFAKVPITMRQAQATQLNMYKIYTQGY